MSEDKAKDKDEKTEAKQEEKLESKKQEAPKEQKKEEPQAKEAPAEAKTEKKAEAPAEVPKEVGGEEEAPATETDKKSVKVTKMTLEQVEAALDNVQKKMGGFQSRHAQSLLARKNYLARYTEQPVRKAA